MFWAGFLNKASPKSRIVSAAVKKDVKISKDSEAWKTFSEKG